MEEITLKKIVETLETIVSEEDLKPYKDLGNGLYELPGNVICNKKGLDKYLSGLQNQWRSNND